MNRRELIGAAAGFAAIATHGRTATNPQLVFAAPKTPGEAGWARAGDGQRIRFDRYGAKDAGVTLVLVHGWLCDRSYWSDQVDRFAGDHGVLTLDLPGHGESEGGRLSWGPEQYGDDVARVVAAAGVGRVVLVGHSMGGPVVVEAARRMPEQTAGVIAVDILQKLKPLPGETSVMAPPMASFEQAEMETLLQGFMFNDASDPVLKAEVSRAMSLADPARALAIRRDSSTYDPDAGMRAIAKIPFGLITSTRRPTFPEQIRDAHPKASIRVMPGVGHFIMNERPEPFEVLVREQLLLMSGEVREV